MGHMKKDISKIGYSEFTLLLSEDVSDRFQLVLDYDEFNIYVDTATDRYFYLESGENDASDFFEVERIACLTYDIMHDLQIPPNEAGVRMSELFECDMCGEVLNDNNIQYMWFKRKENIMCYTSSQVKLPLYEADSACLTGDSTCIKLPCKVRDLVDKIISHNEIVAIWERRKGEEGRYHVLLWQGMAWEMPDKYLDRTFLKIFGTVPDNISKADTVNIAVIPILNSAKEAEKR